MDWATGAVSLLGVGLISMGAYLIADRRSTVLIGIVLLVAGFFTVAYSVTR